MVCPIGITIVRHVREHRKSTNTARLAWRALSPGCQLLNYGDRHQPFDASFLPEPSYLLFPEALDHSGQPDPNGPPVHDLSSGPPPQNCQNLILLDGTWSQARRMSHRLQAVAQLPRLSFSQIPPRARLRKPPTSNTSATLEALGLALWYLAGEEVGRPLLDLFDVFVDAYHQQSRKPPKQCPV